MHTDVHQSPVAIAYARALLELANEAKSADEMGQELRDLTGLIDTTPQFGQILNDPAIGVEERAKLIHRVFDGRLSKTVLNFLGLLNEKGRLGLLPSISGAFDDLLDQQMGKMDVDVTVAQQLDPTQLEEVRQKVSGALKRDAVVEQHVDASIIGGLVLRVQDRLFDGSVRAQLDAIRRQLLAARPV